MYKRILIVVDARPVTRAAVKEGSSVARAHGAEVVFFHVLPVYPLPIADIPPTAPAGSVTFEQAAKETGKRLLAQASQSADKMGVAWSIGIGKAGDEAGCIVEAARRRRCDLIVVASEGRNALVRLLTRSVIPGLITASHVPVLVCKNVPRASATEKVALLPVKPRRAVKRAAVVAWQ